MGESERIRARRGVEVRPPSLPDLNSIINLRKQEPICPGAGSKSNLVRDKRLELEKYVKAGLMTNREAADELEYFAKENGLLHALSWQLNELNKLSTNKADRDYIDSLVEKASGVLNATQQLKLADNRKDVFALPYYSDSSISQAQQSILVQDLQTTLDNPLAPSPSNLATTEQSILGFSKSNAQTLPIEMQNPSQSDRPSIPETISTSSNSTAQNGLLSSMLYAAMQVADAQAQRFLGLVDLGLSAIAPDSKQEKLDTQVVPPIKVEKPIESSDSSTSKDPPPPSPPHSSSIIITKSIPSSETLALSAVTLSEKIVSPKSTAQKPVVIPIASDQDRILISSAPKPSVSIAPLPSHMIGSGRKLFFLAKDAEAPAKDISKSEIISSSNGQNVTSKKPKSTRAKKRKVFAPTKIRSNSIVPSLRQKTKHSKEQKKPSLVQKPNLIPKRRARIQNAPHNSSQEISRPKQQKIKQSKLDGQYVRDKLRRTNTHQMPSMPISKTTRRTIKADDKRVARTIEERKSDHKRIRENQKTALSKRIAAILLKKKTKREK